jgi:hypothetical protein
MLLLTERQKLSLQQQILHNTEYEVAKANIVHDGTTAYVTVYGLTSTSGTDLSTYTVTLAGGSVLLQAVSAGGQQSAKVQYSVVAV